MEKSRPILSVVVPTINRYETLVPLLNALHAWESAEFEVIISDNSDDNSALLKNLAELGDKRFRYWHHAIRLSAIENCDFAVGQSQGRFICFIGDDDGVSHRTIDLCIEMEKRGIESVSFSSALYTWPNMEHAVAMNSRLNGALVLSPIDPNIREIDITSELQAVYRSGALSMGSIPRLYHGIVARNALKQVFDACGTYFPGPVPDMSNAIALCSVIKVHAFLGLPYVVSGHSAKSMSGRNARRQHQGELSAEPTLPKGVSEKWDARIPKFWSGPTIWAAACVESTSRMMSPVCTQQINFARLYAACLVFCRREFHRRVLDVMFAKKEILPVMRITALVFFYCTVLWSKRATTLSAKFLRARPRKYCANIRDAMEEVEQILSTHAPVWK